MIPFNDFKVELESIKDEVNEVINQVLESGRYILGENVEEFEKEFAKYSGAKFGIGVGNGLEALQIALYAHGIGKGDEVITVANTAVATVLAISFTGAKPVFADIDPITQQIDVSQIPKKITKRTKAILPVHLFGHPVDMGPLLDLADKNSLLIIEDACQSHGALYKGKKVGTIGDAGCFSFYPTKNLGAYGDGGMILTNSKEMAEKMACIRNYGQKTRYVHIYKGLNSRLDELQAAILRVKLKHLEGWINQRREKAKLYNKLLGKTEVVTPVEMEYGRHVYHLYVIKSKNRDRLQRFLQDNGITTLIHYPIPIHLQVAYKNLKMTTGALPVTEEIANRILSLPIYPQLMDSQIEEIVENIQKFERISHLN